MVKKYFTYQLIGWLLLACLLGREACGQTANPAAPDIIYILSDDQAYTDYSFMGHQHIRTPNLDQLAKESRLFTRGYVPDSLCRPSLATIITGLYPHQHGIVGNDPPPANGWVGKKRPAYTDAKYQEQIEKYLELHIDRMETLPDRLNKLGYLSYQTGKWWEGNPRRGGFDEGMTHGDHSRGARHGDVGLEIGRKGMQPIEEYVKKARSAGKPYFLWYAPMLPAHATQSARAIVEQVQSAGSHGTDRQVLGHDASGSTKRLASCGRSSKSMAALITPSSCM